ncbi:MAG: cysteine hydrolase [Vallitaleaceae bacterium]|nr:cysteine hydrolase [Vallitaleaceae bacterium]
MTSKNDFIKKSGETLSDLYDLLQNLEPLDLKDLPPQNSVLIIVDMINGFAREGALQSPRVDALIPGITELSLKCDEKGIKKIAFADCHTDASPEFEAYPAHCKMDTSESEIVSEIKEVGGYTLIPKNSTNGFLEPVFQQWLIDHSKITNFIIVGDCTDICIQQFAITLKTWFNRKDKKVNVIVPVNLVDTYDFGLHDADLLHVVALYNMMGNGVKVVKSIG